MQRPKMFDEGFRFRLRILAGKAYPDRTLAPGNRHAHRSHRIGRAFLSA